MRRRRRGVRGCCGGVLGLAARSIGRAHETTPDMVREPDPMVPADEVEAEVYSAGGAGAGEHLAGVDEEDVLIDIDLGVSVPHDVRVVPVRGGSSAVEKSCRSQGERSSRDGSDPGPAGIRVAQRFQHLRRRGGVGGVSVARHEDRVCPVESLETVADGVRQSVPAVDCSRMLAADAHLVRHARSFGKDVGGYPDVERLRAVEDKNTNSVVRCGGHPGDASPHRRSIQSCDEDADRDDRVVRASTTRQSDRATIGPWA